MLLANYVDDIERLTGIGLGPFIALLVVFIVVLVGAIVGVCGFFWKQLGKAWSKRDEERQLRDAERAVWHKQVEKRLRESEDRHQDCEADREKLNSAVSEVKVELQRMKHCPHSGCPMRLPP
jgi:hypothetical protein